MSDAARRTGFLAGLAGLICVALITSAGAQAPDLAARYRLAAWAEASWYFAPGLLLCVAAICCMRLM